MRWRVILFFLLCTVFAFANHSDDLLLNKEEVKKTIVRIKSGNKYSTGFFYKKGDQVVTTLHSIADPNAIEIYIPQQGKWCNVKITNVSKSNDLVLLKTNGCMSPNYLSAMLPSRPAVDTKVFTIGYYGNNDKYQDRDFVTGLTEGTRLKDLLHASAKKEIASLGFPSLNTEIVYLKGQLLHGFSGSPIADAQGRLVGISNGGLENGAVGISWCILANALNTLENSQDAFPYGSIGRVKSLFSADAEELGSVSVGNGQFQFDLMRSRTFAQLNETADYAQYPELGLYQVIQALANEGIDYGAFKFDIYVEGYTGATLVIPSGLKLMQEDGIFYATSADGSISVVVTLSPTQNIQYSSLLFEQALQELSGIYTWEQDYRATYSQPFVREDGMIINRKAWYNYQPNSYVFEVVAGKWQTFLGVAAFLNNRFNFQTAEFDDQVTAAKYLLASQLTTFTFQ
ncbi:MAG: serine protease [Leeuwenhoekiella sp.]